jgi:hypothetical protein
MDSQATGLSKAENDTVIATRGPAVCGHATAGAIRENVPDIVRLPQYDDGKVGPVPIGYVREVSLNAS